MAHAKAKKKSVKKPATVTTEATIVEELAKGKEFTFVSRDKSAEMKMSAPVKKNNASEVVFRVLGEGELPKGLKLQWADSYSAHFINRKGKNAVGASSVQNLLVINGIADELEAIGVKGIIKPTAKPFRAIKVASYSPSELSDLASKIAKVLGFTKKAKPFAAPVKAEV